MNKLDNISALEERILAEHAGFVSRLNGSQPAVFSLRSEGIESFSKLGIPNQKLEAWKYTPVDKWLARAPALPHFAPAENQGVIPETPLPEAYQVVSTDGEFRPELSSLPSGEDVIICSLSKALTDYPDLVESHLGRYADRDSEAFTALNTAFIRHGLFLWVKSGTHVDRPIVLRDIRVHGDRTLIQPRNLFLFEANSAASIVEWYQDDQTSQQFENTVTEIYVGEGAKIDQLHVFDRGPSSDLVNALFVYQEKDSYFATNHITLSGSLVRHNLNFLPDAEGCETHLLGLVIAKDDMHVDIHSFVDHAKPNAFSNELYKCILDDRATGVFNGKVMVRQDAQQINAYQSNRSILLSENARMYSKPELEIYADDVKCSHGATTGQLDEEAIFYLRSRGLSRKAAILMLLEAFAREVMDEVSVEALHEPLIGRLRELLDSADE